MLLRTLLRAPRPAAARFRHRRAFASRLPPEQQASFDDPFADLLDDDDGAALPAAASAAPAAPAPSSPRPSPDAPFTPRTTFTPSASLPTSYFHGHHQRGLRAIAALAPTVDLVLECRDHRVPLASRNPLLEAALHGRPRLVVYTKTDLAAAGVHDALARLEPARAVAFVDSADRASVRRLVERVRAAARARDRLTGARVLVVGMPNVGKSSLLNALRDAGTGGAKAARTGGMPGVTRKVSGTVRISDDPLVYVIDSPGVFVPYMPNPHAMLSLALVGSIGATIIPPVAVADFLLYQLNRHAGASAHYAAYCAPTNDVLVLLEAVARRTGRLRRGGVPDVDAAALWLVQRFRDGKLGRFVLDDVAAVGPAGWHAWDEQERERWGQSMAQGRKRVRDERKELRKRRGKEGAAAAAAAE